MTATTAPKTADATVSGAGPYGNGATATLAASAANDCYFFENWTVAGKTVSTNNPYTFTVTKTEALTANFKQWEYTIATSSSPANGGAISGGGIKGCGTDVTLKATAKPGFAFQNWTTAQGAIISVNPFTFEVSSNVYLVAHFMDKAKPTVMVTNITAGDMIGTASFTIEGSAKDNEGVAAVYYNLNGAGWVQASNLNNFEPWYAFVTLTPNSPNSVSAYAVDTSTNFSTTNTVNFKCTALGLAPLSIAGQAAVLAEGTNVSDTNYVSFDSAMYVRYSTYTNVGSEVGTYTYTPTGPNTAALAPHRVLPTQDSGANNSALDLTFIDAYNATYTNLSGGAGSITFYTTEESVPPELDGVVMVAKSFYLGSGSYESTNSFGSASFTTEDNQGSSAAGTYTFTPFTQLHALLVQTYTDPTTKAGTTNDLVLMFNEGTLAASCYYSPWFWGMMALWSALTPAPSPQPQTK